MLLAIDTSAVTSVAVLSSGDSAAAIKTLSLVNRGDAFGHAENIGLAIAEALNAAGIAAEQISAVAIGRGPASYTGLRVGMAAALAFAQARSLPLSGVATLDAVAAGFGDEHPFVVTADAKRRELFVGFYSGLAENGLPRRSGDLEVLSAEALELRVGAERVIAQPCDAELVGRYALLAELAGLELSDTSALYLRSPDVTLSPRKPVS